MFQFVLCINFLSPFISYTNPKKSEKLFADSFNQLYLKGSLVQDILKWEQALVFLKKKNQHIVLNRTTIW